MDRSVSVERTRSTEKVWSRSVATGASRTRSDSRVAPPPPPSPTRRGPPPCARPEDRQPAVRPGPRPGGCSCGWSPRGRPRSTCVSRTSSRSGRRSSSGNGSRSSSIRTITAGWPSITPNEAGVRPSTSGGRQRSHRAHRRPSRRWWVVGRPAPGEPAVVPRDARSPERWEPEAHRRLAGERFGGGAAGGPIGRAGGAAGSWRVDGGRVRAPEAADPRPLSRKS